MVMKCSIAICSTAAAAAAAAAAADMKHVWL
jgi:hypothetical protein